MNRRLVFEIGVEEVPSTYLPPALEQLEQGARAALAEARLEFAAVRVLGTPRRLTLMVEGLAERQPDRDEEATGPSVKVAYDAEGRPTKALLGFCAGRGADVAAVRRVTSTRGEYVVVTVHVPGKPALEVLPELLATLATRLQFPKTMRWLDDDTRFARPVRWLVALLDREVVPVRAFGLEAGRVSRGHRFLDPGPAEIADAASYLATLERVHVIADPTKRAALIREQVDALAASVGGAVIGDAELLEINNFLVEWPTAVLGSFEGHFTELPNEVIITALKEHQRFFAVSSAGAGPAAAVLKPNFIAVRNGDGRGLDTVRKGNQDVLVARLEDAKFYWDTDRMHTPAERVDALASVVWMEGLGSLRDKAARLESLGGWLAQRLGPESEDAVRRAALLCKTDLLGEMIGSGKEYASLEGVMGGYYAQRAGEPAAVAAAIAEHYRPRGPGDALPESAAGALLALADKLDHVAGAFVAGKVPSGSEDPYGVRRAGNGAIRILIERRFALDLREATLEATRTFFAAGPDLPQAEIVKRLGEFWRGRVEGALADHALSYDTVAAALEARVARADGRTRPGWTDPADALRRARTLRDFRSDARFEPLVVLFKRVSNILRAATETLPPALDAARLSEPAERALHAALESARSATAPLWAERDYDAILPALLAMEEAIHAFFDQVLVNAEDAAVRANRLRLLTEVRDLFLRGWDLSKAVVEGEKGA